MATFQQHIQYLIKNGVARTNRFQVIIPLPEPLLPKTDNTGQEKTSTFWGSDVIKKISSFLGGGTEIARGLDVMAQSVDIPGKNLTTTEIKYNGDFYKIPYANVYESHQMIFKCSRDMYEKNIIDEWMNLIFDPKAHYVGYMDDYATNITINMLNEQDEIVHSIVLLDAFPTMCTPITLSSDDRDSYAQLQTMWMYRRWVKAEENVNLSNGVSSLSQTPLGPIVTPVLANPAVQRALGSLEDQTGLDLEGEAVAIYNQLDQIVKGSTGSSTNQTASLVEGMKAQTAVNDNISEDQKATLIDKMNNVITNLRS